MTSHDEPVQHRAPGRRLTGERWEHRALNLLEWPANLGLVNVVWFLFSLPVVTWFTASVALIHSLERWLQAGDGRIASNFWGSWKRQWRRTLPIGVVSTAVLAILLANAIFLVTREVPAALFLLPPTIVLLASWLMLHLALIPVIALFPELPVRTWLREAAVLAIRHPLTSVVNATLTTALVYAVVWLPTLVPFVSAAPIGFLAMRTVARHLEA